MEVKRSEIEHADQGWKSIETALHSLLTKIEGSMQEKQFAQVVFMDVQGSFDSITVETREEAIERRDVGRRAFRWIVNMLKCKNIHLTYQGESVEARVVKCCPQGGALSPLLWCIVVDSLLLKLNTLGYTAYAYAGGLVIVIHSKHLNTVAGSWTAGVR